MIQKNQNIIGMYVTGNILPGTFTGNIIGQVYYNNTGQYNYAVIVS